MKCTVGTYIWVHDVCVVALAAMVILHDGARQLRAASVLLPDIAGLYAVVFHVCLGYVDFSCKISFAVSSSWCLSAWSCPFVFHCCACADPRPLPDSVSFETSCPIPLCCVSIDISSASYAIFISFSLLFHSSTDRRSVSISFSWQRRASVFVLTSSFRPSNSSTQRSTISYMRSITLNSRNSSTVSSQRQLSTEWQSVQRSRVPKNSHLFRCNL